MSEEKSEKVLENLKVAFELFYKKPKSESFRDIFREVYKNDYPEEQDPDGFVTNTDIKRIIENLKVGPGDRFIDLGCGRGGPGVWIARKTGANYLGVDLSENAIKKAKELIEELETKLSIRFQTGNICSLDVPDKYFDGAISIDVISFVTDIKGAFLEVARILRPNANFVFTTWEIRTSEIKRDYRTHLIKAGFEVKIYEALEDWEKRQREVYQKTLQLKKTLIRDMGSDGAFVWIMDAKRNLPSLKDLTRIFCVATKK